MKKLVGSDIGKYQFSPGDRAVSFVGLPPLALEQVLTVFNATDGTMVYSFASPALGGSLAGNVLTLTYNTSGMSSSDRLLIYVDLPDSVSIPTVQAETLTQILAELRVHSLLLSQGFNSTEDLDALRASLLNQR